jgi:hypothetical protein
VIWWFYPQSNNNPGTLPVSPGKIQQNPPITVNNDAVSAIPFTMNTQVPDIPNGRGDAAVNFTRGQVCYRSPPVLDPVALTKLRDFKYDHGSPVDLTPKLPPRYHQEPPIATKVNVPEPDVPGNAGRPGFTSKGEAICRDFLERFFKRSFPRVRPAFLVNPETGRRMELDGYNEELGIAVEYNGIQHYKWPAWPAMSLENFKKQVYRDQIKIELCDFNNVFLIVVPYNVPKQQIPMFIREKLKLLNY